MNYDVDEDELRRRAATAREQLRRLFDRYGAKPVPEAVEHDDDAETRK